MLDGLPGHLPEHPEYLHGHGYLSGPAPVDWRRQ